MLIPKDKRMPYTQTSITPEGVTRYCSKMGYQTMDISPICVGGSGPKYPPARQWHSWPQVEGVARLFLLCPFSLTCSPTRVPFPLKRHRKVYPKSQEWIASAWLLGFGLDHLLWHDSLVTTHDVLRKHQELVPTFSLKPPRRAVV